MPTRLKKQPIFTTVRTGVGAVAVDSSTINDVNYPLTSAIEIIGTGERLAAYWYAGGGTTGPFDHLDLQLLERDVKYSTTGRWIEGETLLGVRANEVVYFLRPRSSQFYLRVVGVTCTAGTGLVLRAASTME